MRLLIALAIAGALAARTMKQLTEEFNEPEKQSASAAVEMVDGIAAVKAFGRLDSALFS